MARITVTNQDHPEIVAIIREYSDADGEIWYDSECQACGQIWYDSECQACGQIDTDRGAFANTIESASIHVDMVCPRLNG
jgi:hypothetical protein